MDGDGAIVRLTVPVGPDDHVVGPADAPVTLVEYGDFACPYCGVAERAIRAIRRRYPAELRLVFRNFPLQMHRRARAAAETSEFAADHGKFWEMHDLLYRHQDALEESHLLGYARDLGLDAGALATALREQTYVPIIEETKDAGEDSGIPGTPAFFLNGVLFEEEPTIDNLANAIDWLVQHGSHE
ncbi:MAG: DsbA family protein [Candidatus Elarobacter sp.]